MQGKKPLKNGTLLSVSLHYEIHRSSGICFVFLKISGEKCLKIWNVGQDWKDY